MFSFFKRKKIEQNQLRLKELEAEVESAQKANLKFIKSTTTEIKKTTGVIKREDVTALLYEAINGTNK